MRVRVDVGGGSFMPMCWCGWRGLPALEHGQALRDARHHELRAHPGHKDALYALRRHQARTTP